MLSREPQISVSEWYLSWSAATAARATTSGTGRSWRTWLLLNCPPSQSAADDELLLLDPQTAQNIRKRGLQSQCEVILN